MAISDLTGQVALVTGGGRGIGRAIAMALAGAGARVAVLARSADELAETVRQIASAGGRAQAVIADVTDRASVLHAVADTERAFGPIDLLVNNAAIFGPLGPLWESDPADWWQAMNVNVRGPLLCTHTVLPSMIARRRGRIVNIASGPAPFPYFSSYATTKTALIRMTECVALETKPHGVSVFSVGPGSVRTAMSEHSLNSAEGRKWIPWYRRIFDEGLDLPPERPAQLVVTLASGKADALSGLYLTPHDDLDALIANLARVEAEHLHTLRVRALSVSTAAASVAAIRDAAARAPKP